MRAKPFWYPSIAFKTDVDNYCICNPEATAAMLEYRTNTAAPRKPGRSALAYAQRVRYPAYWRGRAPTQKIIFSALRRPGAEVLDWTEPPKPKRPRTAEQAKAWQQNLAYRKDRRKQRKREAACANNPAS
jgi:hypothetical protein